MGKNIGNLDRFDRQLLYWLDLNCRESLSSLARKMHSSPAKVAYRRDQLVKNGAINSFITLVDYRKLGLRGYGSYLKLKEMSKGGMEKVVERIKQIPTVSDILLCSGAYDLQVIFLVSSSDEAAEGLWSMRGILEDYILDEALIVNLRTQFFAREHFLDGNPGRNVKPRLVLDSHRGGVEIDDTDKAILAVLAERADWSVWRVAKKAKVAGPTAYNRIKKMEKAGVIVGYTAKMNPNLRGYYLYRVLVKLRYMPKKKRAQLTGFLDRHPLIYRSTFTLGKVDMTYDVRVADDMQLRDLLRQVYEQFSGDVVRQDWVRVHEIIRFSFYYSDKK